MSTGPPLTTTSYAILGLLAARPWCTYELTQQMDRSLGRSWPRAESKLYEEPKKLVRRGLAHAAKETVGRRPRTVYSITPEGRYALANWLRHPGAGPVLESEQLLQVFFADSGSTADTLSTLRAARAWAFERNADNLATAHADGRAPFPERAAQTMVVGRFLTEYYRLVATWAEWAAGVVEQWPDQPRHGGVGRDTQPGRLVAPGTRRVQPMIATGASHALRSTVMV
ncbi:helix-turn-helix transcriptional regulator [Streptomyces sp. NY05-11A]|uniref:helix-turn-helix transcriptional regulator n=1 Tax=Streptomyces soliscabiei TaxID=588897 RepID=UPI0029B39DDF|nr:helix-turn-helix transcriptional regulator [Streptomyces sp. NY05-11A]MDX2681661.1 helix-turn-helix transcriptional regulator [Streptomyces sp. NY05-11A]